MILYLWSHLSSDHSSKGVWVSSSIPLLGLKKKRSVFPGVPPLYSSHTVAHVANYRRVVILGRVLALPAPCEDSRKGEAMCVSAQDLGISSHL